MGKTSRNHTRRYTAKHNTRRSRQAIWQHEPCKECRAPVIIIEERVDGGRLRGGVIDATPSPAATLVRDSRGYITRDYSGNTNGSRWAWHNCPVRNGYE